MEVEPERRTAVDLYDEQDPGRLYQFHADAYRSLYGRQRIAATLALLRKVTLGDATILDIGPGAGLWAAYFSKVAPRARIHLLDIRASLLRAASETMIGRGSGPPAKLWHSEVTKAGLPASSFDLIFCKDVIEHVVDDGAFLRAIARSLKPGGHLLVTTQNRLSISYLIQGFWHRRIKRVRWCGGDPTHLRFYDVWELRRLLRRYGLAPFAYSGAYWFPYNLPFRGCLAKLVQMCPVRERDFPISDRPFGGVGWFKKMLSFPECARISHVLPFCVTGWSLGILARNVKTPAPRSATRIS